MLYFIFGIVPIFEIGKEISLNVFKRRATRTTLF